MSNFKFKMFSQAAGLAFGLLFTANLATAQSQAPVPAPGEYRKVDNGNFIVGQPDGKTMNVPTENYAKKWSKYFQFQMNPPNSDEWVSAHPKAYRRYEEQAQRAGHPWGSK